MSAGGLPARLHARLLRMGLPSDTTELQWPTLALSCTYEVLAGAEAAAALSAAKVRRWETVAPGALRPFGSSAGPQPPLLFGLLPLATARHVFST